MKLPLPAAVRGALAFALIVVNTLAWSALIIVLSLVKLVLPVAGVRRLLDPLLNAMANTWVAGNNAIFRVLSITRWEITGVAQLEPADWYLVISNHQSWVDILVLQRALGGRIPLLKFFLKHELIYVPVIGLSWWALDFPFLRRHGKAALKKNPALAQQDRDATRRACEKFSLVPTSVMNFPEGTRFTATKHAGQGPRYRHLLAPKSGALAMSMNALGEKFRSLIDVTIVYPDGVPTFWQFLCGRCPRIVAQVRQLPVPAELCSGDYVGDSTFRGQFHRWVGTLWDDKDAAIAGLLAREMPKA